MTTDTERCGKIRSNGDYPACPCVLDKGHDRDPFSDHRDKDGDSFDEATMSLTAQALTVLTEIRDRLPVPSTVTTPLTSGPTSATCPAVLTLHGERYACVRAAGHSGRHKDQDGDYWSVIGV